MGYSIKSLKQELVAKGYSDDGLVGWGNNASATSGAIFGAVGGALAGAFSKMHVVCKRGDDILIIPFTNKEILYSNGIVFNKQIIEKAQVKGLFLSKKLVIVTKNGKKSNFPILQGVGDVKAILQKLGF